MAKKFNKANFPTVHLWVSSKCVAKSGKDTYWASIDEFEEGTLLYLCRSVWEGLSEVNERTVFERLKTGSFEITEAHDQEGNVLTSSNGETIYQISKAKESVECQW